jgi:hypothetical protein
LNFKARIFPRLFCGFIPANLWQDDLMNLEQLGQTLVALGCPAEKSSEMAAQLDKRARQLAAEKSRSYEDAMQHLLTLIRQGWSAKEKGL